MTFTDEVLNRFGILTWFQSIQEEVAMIVADYSLARERAEMLLRQYAEANPPVKVYEIAKQLGFNIFEATFPPPHDRSIQGYLAWQDKRIVVNAADAIVRKRFTVAHEIGHTQLHASELEKDPDLGVMYRQAVGAPNGDYREQEANCFAAELLMPVAMMRKYYNLVSLYDLARIFIVSTESISLRIDILKREDAL